MKSLLQGLVGAIVGGGLTYALLTFVRLPRFDLDATALLILALLVVPMYLSVVGIHEAGHLAAGVTQGFTPYLFIVGPIKLERRGGRWTFGGNRSISKFGGLAAGIPEDVNRLRQRLLVLIAGGPVASLVTGAAGLALLYGFAPPGGPRITLSGADATIYVAVLLFTVMSLIIAGIALMPTRSEGYSSDGSQLLHFRHRSPAVEAEVALLALSISSVAGRRPAEWDLDLLQRALTLPPASPRGPLVRLLAHLHALDRGDVAGARRYLEDALANEGQLNRLSRPSLMIHAAEFSALHDEDPAAARRYFEDSGDGTLMGIHTRRFAEAAVLHAEGRDGVDQRLAEAEDALPDALDRGGALMLIDRIVDLRRRRVNRVGSQTFAAAARLPGVTARGSSLEGDADA